MKRTFAILSVVAVMALSGLAIAGPGGGPGMMGQGYGYGAQVTPEQAKAHQAKLAKFMESTLDLRKAIAVKRIELQTARFQVNPDTAKSQALYSEMVDLRAQLAKKRMEILGDSAGFGPGYGRGHGMRGGRGYGMRGGGGGYGPGTCWR